MNDIQIKTDEASLQDTITRFIETVEEVPFGNSDWQNRQAIVNCELTPERAYRHASLRIMNRLQALSECYYSLRKEDIEVKKLERKLSTEQDDLERELLQIEISRKASNRPYTKKLIQDAIQEIESLQPVIQSIGKLTREKFEAGEGEHFRLKYHNQATRKNDSLLCLEAMGVNLKSGEKVQEFVSLFESIVGVNTLLP